jgi:TetR/AcrR family transcriptional regulator, regulator of cefoperazone and chloramphenicol sensitivity
MTDSTSLPRRRPAVGGYARGEETRARIVEAALKVFGEEGYVRASTRRIAEEAGVRPPALQYYFDSKEGLHRACAERILAAVAPLRSALDEADRRLASEGASGAAAILCDLLDVLVDTSLDTKADVGKARFMARAQAEGEGPALPMIRERLVLPMYEVSARLTGSALGREAGDCEVRLRASVILAQAHAFGAGRENTLRALQWPDFQGGRREAIKRVLRAHTLAALQADLDGPVSSSPGPGG